MPTTPTVHPDGIAEVVMDNPPVNALTVAGWFELADIVRALGEDPAVRVVVLRAEGRGFNAGVDIKEMQATEGFDALIGANRGCFAAFAAVYECAVPVIAAVQRVLPRRRHRPRRQRRHHRRLRRRHLRAARGRPGRARRGHPPGPPRAAAQDAGDGVHVGDRDRGRAAPLRLGAAGRADATELRDAALEVAARDRGEEPDGDPGGQGVAQRHRPVRREAQLPVRAGLHVRAQPVGRGRRAPRRVRRQAGRRSTTK